MKILIIIICTLATPFVGHPLLCIGVAVGLCALGIYVYRTIPRNGKTAFISTVSVFLWLLYAVHEHIQGRSGWRLDAIVLWPPLLALTCYSIATSFTALCRHRKLTDDKALRKTLGRGILLTVSSVSLLVGVLYWPTLSSLVPRLDCRMLEVNIRTGQLRDSRYLLFLRLQQHLEETPVSSVLHAPIQLVSIPAWQTVKVFAPSFTRHSRFYLYCGAPEILKGVETVFATEEADEYRRQKIATAILCSFQTSGGSSKASAYYWGLMHPAWPSAKSYTKWTDVAKGMYNHQVSTLIGPPQEQQQDRWYYRYDDGHVLHELQLSFPAGSVETIKSIDVASSSITSQGASLIATGLSTHVECRVLNRFTEAEWISHCQTYHNYSNDESKQRIPAPDER